MPPHPNSLSPHTSKALVRQAISAAITTYGFIASLTFLVAHLTGAWFASDTYLFKQEMFIEGAAYFALLISGGLLLCGKAHAVKITALSVILWIYMAIQQVGFVYVVQKQVAKFNTDGALQWKLILDDALVLGVIGVLLTCAVIWLSANTKRNAEQN